MWKLTWRGLRSMAGRFIMTVLAVALGVGYLIGTLALRDTMADTFNKISASTLTDDLYVVGAKIDDKDAAQADSQSTGEQGANREKSRGLLPDKLLEAIENVPGIAQATPGYVQTVVALDEKGQALAPNTYAPTMVYAGYLDSADELPKLDTGKFFTPGASDQVVLEKGALEIFHVKVGQKIQLQVEGERHPVTIVGSLDYGTSMAGASIIIADPQTVKNWIIEGRKARAKTQIQLSMRNPSDASLSVLSVLSQADPNSLSVEERKELGKLVSKVQELQGENAASQQNGQKPDLGAQVAQLPPVSEAVIQKVIDRQYETAVKKIDETPIKVSSFSIKLAKGRQISQVKRDLEEVLKEKYKVYQVEKTPDVLTRAENIAESNQSVEEQVGYVNTFLLVFVGIAFFVGIFIISNTFRMLVQNQHRQFALLRAIGASGRQIFGVVTVQSLLIGIFGGVIGLGIGYAIVQGLISLLASLSLKLGQVNFSFNIIATGIITGIVVTVIGALLPARSAAKTPPMDALRKSAGANQKGLLVPTIIGTVLTVAGIGAMVYSNQEDISYPGTMLGVGAFLFLIGVLALSPMLTKPLAWLLSWPLRIMRPTGKLALKNVLRNPRRTSATTGALTVGVTLMTLGSVMASTMQSAAEQMIVENITSDLIVSNGDGAQPPLSLVDKISQIKYVKQTNNEVSILAGNTTLNKQGKIVTTTDPVQVKELTQLDNNGRPRSLSALGAENQAPAGQLKPLKDSLRVTVFPRSTLTNDVKLEVDQDKWKGDPGRLSDFTEQKDNGLKVLLNSQEAKNYGLKVGDHFPLQVGNRLLTVQLAAVVRTNPLLNGVGLFSEQLKNIYGVTANSELPVTPLLNPSIFITIEKGDLSKAQAQERVLEVQKQINKLLKDHPTILCLTKDDYQSVITKQVNVMLGVIYALLGLSIFIAILGIINTQTMSIYERIREIGMLRAIGYSRGRIAAMVLCESTLTAVIGAAIGLVSGLAISYWLFTYLIEIGNGIERITYPWGQVIAMLVGAALVGMLAGLLPARRAAKTRLLTAIAEDR